MHPRNLSPLPVSSLLLALVSGCFAPDPESTLASGVDANKRLVRRYYEEVLSAGEVDRIAEFIAPEYVEVYANERHPLGREGAEEHVRGVRDAYPDLELTVEQQIGEGEWVVSRITMRGTLARPWLGIEPTGKRLEVSVVNIDRVLAGRIVEHGGAANLLEPLMASGAVKAARADPGDEDERGGRRDTASGPQLSPRERDQRGDEHLLAGRFEQALTDFDAFLEAEPEQDAHHWRRGIAYYYAGRYEEGAAQFERHRSVNPNDVENAAWHFLCKARATSVEEARAGILPAGPDSRAPMRPLFELFAGRGTQQDVLAQAAASPQRDALFFAHLYLGLYNEALGDEAEARRHIQLAATTHGRSHYMGRVARLHASLLLDGARARPAGQASSSASGGSGP